MCAKCFLFGNCAIGVWRGVGYWPRSSRIWVLQAGPLSTVPWGRPCLSWDTFQVSPLPTLLPHAGSWGRASGKDCADSWTEYRSWLPRETRGKSKAIFLVSVNPGQAWAGRPVCTALSPASTRESSFVQGASQLRALFFPLCSLPGFLKTLSRSSACLQGSHWTY